MGELDVQHCAFFWCGVREKTKKFHIFYVFWLKNLDPTMETSIVGRILVDFGQNHATVATLAWVYLTLPPHPTTTKKHGFVRPLPRTRCFFFEKCDFALNG